MAIWHFDNSKRKSNFAFKLKQTELYKKLISETLIYGIGAILPRLINFLLTRLFTDHIPTDDFSMFNQLYSAISFVNIILTFGFETAYFRFMADPKKSKNVFNTSFWFLFFNASIFVVLIYIFDIPLANHYDYKSHPEFLIWFAWIAFFDTICVIPFAYLRFYNRPILYSGIKLLQSFLQTILIVAFFYWIPAKALQSLGLDNAVSFPFYANLIASFIGIPLLIGILKQVRFKFDKALFKDMIKYSYPIMLAGLAYMVNENLDKLIQRNIISDSDAGAYGGCYKLTMLMTLFVTAYRMGVEPFFFKTAQEKDSRKTYANILLYFTIVCAGVMIGLLGNMQWLKHIFIANDDYFIAIQIVPIIIIANLFFGIYYNLSTWYKVTDRTIVGTYISWAGAIITIVFNFIFIPIWGFMASAWATLVAYGSMMIISYVWGQKEFKIPYKTNKILLYLFIAIAFSVIEFYLLNSNIIYGNLFLFTYIAIVFLLEKSTLKKQKI